MCSSAFYISNNTKNINAHDIFKMPTLYLNLSVKFRKPKFVPESLLRSSNKMMETEQVRILWG